MEGTKGRSSMKEIWPVRRHASEGDRRRRRRRGMRERVDVIEDSRCKASRQPAILIVPNSHVAATSGS